MMAISRKELRPRSLPDAVTPIKYLTENGFSIVRKCDVDHSVQNSPSDCGFFVARDEQSEHEVHVSFAPELVITLKKQNQAYHRMKLQNRTSV